MKSYEYEYQYEQVKNERLREQLAQSDQRIEWLSKENAALKREAREVSVGLLELRDVTTEALVAMRKRVDHDAAEVEKWRERYHQRSVELAGARRSNFDLSRENAGLRGRVAFLEKALGSKPGTMYFGNEGFFLRGEEER